MEGGADIDTEEAARGVRERESPGLEPASKGGGAVLTALGLSAAGGLATQGCGDLPDLSVETGRKNNTASTTLCHS